MTVLPQLIAATIQDDPDLAKSVQDLATTHPDCAPVISRLLTYIQTKQASTPIASAHGDIKLQPKQGIAQFFSKGASTVSPALALKSTVSPPRLTYADIGPAVYTTNALSFLHPIRKKFVLSLHQKDIALVSATTATTGTPDIVCCAPFNSLYRVIAVPFLERTTKQTALILFFRHSDSIGSKDAIWTVPLQDDGKDFSLQFHEQHKQVAGLTEDLRSPTSSSKAPIPLSSTAASNKRPDNLLISIISYFIKASNPALYSPDACDIIQNPTPAYPNFLAHLKSNQGTIYLLPTGILFAFRKPTLFLRSEAIEAVGVHSVLSRTFDFEVVMRQDSSIVMPEDLEGVPPENKDGKRAVGFGMVDTKEFARMEDWIKKAGIRDRSLSEDLKAKDKAPVTATSSKKRERTADGGGDGNESEGGSSQVSASQQKDGTKTKKQRETYQVDDDDDDDEDDQDFAPESDDEIMEEYDSSVEGSDSDGGGGGGEAGAPARARKVQDEDDEEELGDEDSEDEDEDDDGGENEDEEEQGNGEASAQDEDEEDELLDD